MSKWRLINVREGTAASTRDAMGNTILQTVPLIVIFGRTGGYSSAIGEGVGDQILIYRSKLGWAAQLTGKNGAEITSMLPPGRWEDLHAQAVVTVNLLGRIPDSYPLQEII